MDQVFTINHHYLLYFISILPLMPFQRSTVTGPQWQFREFVEIQGGFWRLMIQTLHALRCDPRVGCTDPTCTHATARVLKAPIAESSLPPLPNGRLLFPVSLVPALIFQLNFFQIARRRVFKLGAKS